MQHYSGAHPRPTALLPLHRPATGRARYLPGQDCTAAERGGQAQ